MKRPIIAAGITLFFYFSGVFLFLAPLPFCTLGLNAKHPERNKLLLFFSAALGLFLFFNALGGSGEGRTFSETFQQVSDQAVGALQGEVNGPKFANNRTEAIEAIQHFHRWLQRIPSLFPALFFVGTVLLFYLQISILSRFGKGGLVGVQKGFYEFRLPPAFLLVFLGAGLSYFANFYLVDWTSLGTLCLNILLAVGFLFFLQGLSLLVFYLRTTSLLLRWVVYGLVLYFTGPLLVLVGLSDAWFDFRRRIPWKSS